PNVTLRGLAPGPDFHDLGLRFIPRVGVEGSPVALASAEADRAGAFAALPCAHAIATGGQSVDAVYAAVVRHVIARVETVDARPLVVVVGGQERHGHADDRVALRVRDAPRDDAAALHA